jgi:hypothetical protein
LFAALAFAAVFAGVSLARSSFNPLSGIGAADHQSQSGDVLGPDAQAQLRADRSPSGGIDQIGARIPDSARFVGALPSGRRVYVMASVKGRLCVVLAGWAESCGNPLALSDPITFTTLFRLPGDPTYAYGVARDGVTAVSFSASDRRVTVPVHHNFFVYESEPGTSPRGFGDVQVTFADGTVRSVG